MLVVKSGRWYEIGASEMYRAENSTSSADFTQGRDTKGVVGRYTAKYKTEDVTQSNGDEGPPYLTVTPRFTGVERSVVTINYNALFAEWVVNQQDLRKSCK